MTIRSASLLAAAALAGLAAPALAQDYDPGPPPPLPDGDWQQEVYQDAGEYAVDPNGYPLPPLRAGESWVYTTDERAQWLDECVANYGYARGEQQGQVIGGVLGGVAGGIAGNRIAGSGNRLGGTLLGAGVGTLAGAVAGGAVGRDSDQDRARAECEAYFAQYEQGYGAPAPVYSPGVYAQALRAGGYREGEIGYVYPYPYPVMWVRVPIASAAAGAGARGYDCGCEEVIEEVVEEQPVPRASRVVPVGDKRIRITK